MFSNKQNIPSRAYPKFVSLFTFGVILELLATKNNSQTANKNNLFFIKKTKQNKKGLPPLRFDPVDLGPQTFNHIDPAGFDFNDDDTYAYPIPQFDEFFDKFGPLENKDSVIIAKHLSKMSSSDANELLEVITNPAFNPSSVSFKTKEQLNKKLETTVRFFFL